VEKKEFGRVEIALSGPGIVASLPGNVDSVVGITVSLPGIAASAPGIAISAPGIAISDPGIGVSAPGFIVSGSGIVVSESGINDFLPGIGISWSGIELFRPEALAGRHVLFGNVFVQHGFTFGALAGSAAEAHHEVKTEQNNHDDRQDWDEPYVQHRNSI